MLVLIDSSELEALDRRELGYDRLTLPIDRFDISMQSGTTPEQGDNDTINNALQNQIGEVYMYASARTQAFAASDEFPLLQSYVDCVMNGYETVFGEGGLHRFMNTTRGWQAPMIKDRLQPRYVRSISLTTEQASRYDQLIAGLSL